MVIVAVLHKNCSSLSSLEVGNVSSLLSVRRMSHSFFSPEHLPPRGLLGNLAAHLQDLQLPGHLGLCLKFHLTIPFRLVRELKVVET